MKGPQVPGDEAPSAGVQATLEQLVSSVILHQRLQGSWHQRQSLLSCGNSRIANDDAFHPETCDGQTNAATTDVRNHGDGDVVNGTDDANDDFLSWKGTACP